jgi:RNA polymerase sigma factor (sigma-70 family)
LKNGEAGSAIHDLQALFEGGTVVGLSDGQLLERFIARRDEAAFEAIVRRHGPMVFGVCRRILRGRHDAEDAFQATFLVLARRAASVAPREKVGDWLHGVAYRTAVKARAVSARRRAREGLTPEVPEQPLARDEGPEPLLAALDREVSRLPEIYRLPIVLCELEEKTHKEAAEQLGWPIGTLSGRLSRARSLLARRLSRNGPALSTGALAALMARDATAGPTGVTASSLARAAVSFANGQVLAAEASSAGAAALTEGMLKMMFLSRLKIAAAMVLLGFLLAGGASLAHRAGAADDAGQAGATPKAIVARPALPAPAPEALQLAQAAAKERQAEPLASYPFQIDPEKVYLVQKLVVHYGDFAMECNGPTPVVPIVTERGVTGVMVMGSGVFRYTPEKSKEISGGFRSAMLRMNPEEQAEIIPLDKGTTFPDRGLVEMSRHILQVIIRHCWQSTKDGGRRQEVLIPPKGAFAAVLYDRTHGDLLISSDGHTATAYSFTDRKVLYEKK